MTSAWARAIQAFMVISAPDGIDLVRMDRNGSDPGAFTDLPVQPFANIRASSFESLTPRSASRPSDETPIPATTSGPSTDPFPASSTPQITKKC